MKMNNVKLFFYLMLAMLFYPNVALSFDLTVCPGVDAKTGEYKIQNWKRTKPSLAPRRKVPVIWHSEVLKFIANAEAGSADLANAYSNVSDTDILSVGFLQWNHNLGSLYTTLFRNLSDDMLNAAPASIRGDCARSAKFPMRTAGLREPERVPN